MTNINAVIHSLEQEDTVDMILKLEGDNQYAARYHGDWYSAIFNIFVGRYYVDDKYGKFPDDRAKRFEEKFEEMEQEEFELEGDER